MKFTNQQIAITVVLALILGSVFLWPAKGDQSYELPDTVDFNFHIKPILSDRCFKCHGPDENARKADLRLDIPEEAFASLDSLGNQFAIDPGNISKSVLVHRISSLDEEKVMPPPESNLSLTAFEIELIKKWIRQGAQWKKHWSFIPPVSQIIPKVKKKSWPENEIDYFILKKLEEQKLQPAKQASKEKLLRRISFDLTGLPPTLDEIEHFIRDDSEDAYAKVIDELLSRPAYGERMASIWLDAARYADSHGYQDDRPRTMWPWRDWVIDAFNSNMSYDSFIVHQLGGDLLPDPGYFQKLATAFNRNHPITQEGGVVNEEYVTEYVADRTNTASTVFMGLTMECARCHDHKYDPIQQKDYYRLFAFFNDIDEKGQINYFDEAPKPNMKVEDAELEQLRNFLEDKIKELESTYSYLNTSSDHPNQSNHPDQGQINIQLEKDVQHSFLLDEVQGLSTVDNENINHRAEMNTGLQSELVAATARPGRFNTGLQFDGHNFLNLGDIGDFEWYHTFSLGCWIKPNNHRKKDQGILVRRNGEQKRGGYELAITTSGKLRMSLVHNQNEEKVVVESRTAISPQTWHHVFVTYDGSGRAAGLNLFINGRLQNKLIKADQLDTKSILTGNDLLAGNWTHRNRIREDIEGFKNGFIDEIKIFHRQLSQFEVASLAKIQIDRSTDLQKEYANLTQSSYADSLRAELFFARRDLQPVPSIMIMESMDTLKKTYVLDRGAYDAPAEEVEAMPPESIMPFDLSLSKNRLGLAQWLTHPDHPLTARVMVNRLWQLMFGSGIVSTPEDFGNQGALPSHPELLDWLALEFIKSDWNIKYILKKMALSSTYRQSAFIDEQKLLKDPQNVYLSRGPNKKLTAEMMRDNALAVSGLLHDSVGGKWVKPYQPRGLWKELANQIGENKYRPGVKNELYRRSLYTYWKRTIPPPTMLTFDASERAVCVVKRQDTSTPLQSLILLNDPQYLEASKFLAAQMLEYVGQGDIRTGLSHGFEKVTSRTPAMKELDILEEMLNEEIDLFSKEPDKAKAYLSVGEKPLDKKYDEIKLAAWTHVANTLINLDEAKMKS